MKLEDVINVLTMDTDIIISKVDCEPMKVKGAVASFRKFEGKVKDLTWGDFLALNELKVLKLEATPVDCKSAILTIYLIDSDEYVYEDYDEEDE